MQPNKIIAPTGPDTLTDAEFLNPDRQYRPMPVWHINGSVSESGARAQLAELGAAGAGGVFIRARAGLDIPYLSRRWFDIIRAICDEAKQLQMLVWLCDDFYLPSGTGNLSVTSREEYRSRFVTHAVYELPAGRSPLPKQFGTILHIHAFPKKDDPAPDDKSAGEALAFTAESDGVYVESAVQCTAHVFALETLSGPENRCYGLNVLSQEAVAAYINHTHELIRSELGDLFGETIVGLYTCESSLLPYHQYTVDGIPVDGMGQLDLPAVPWSDELPELLLGHGFSVPSVLTALFLNRSDSAAARRAYWEITSTCFATVFYNTCREWCEQNGLLLAGRPYYSAGLQRQLLTSGNPYCTLASVHLPACKPELERDAAYSQSIKPESVLPPPKNGLTGPKLISSAAHLSNRARAMSEGTQSGWGQTFSDQRALLTKQAALGINFIAPGTVMYSAEGFRKYDSPPGITQSPSFEHYRVFADYAARLCYAMSQGLPDAPIAVLYPISALEASHTIGSEGQTDRAICDAFDDICLILTQLRLHYDIVDPAYLEDAFLSEGHMYIGDNDYIGVVLPTSAGWNSSADKLLREFTSGGGYVLCISEDESSVMPANIGQGRWRTLPRHDISANREAFRNHLQSFFSEAEEVTLVGEGKEAIFTASRHLVRERLWFFTNTSQAEVSCVIALHCEPSQIMRYDLSTGEVSDFECEKENGQTHFNHTFLPGDALLIGLRASAEKPKKKKAPLKRTRLTPKLSKRIVALPADGWVFTPRSDNVLPITKWDFTITPNALIGKPPPTEQAQQYSAVSYLQLRPPRPNTNQEPQKRPPSSHTTYSYRAVFNSNVSLTNGYKWQSDICLAIDDIAYRTTSSAKDTHVQVQINGHEAPYAPDRAFFEGMRLYRIGSGMRHGENTLEVIIHHYSYFGEPQLMTMPSYIVGGFRLLTRSGRVAIDAPDNTVPLISWAQLGYPHYAGACEYTREFALNPVPARVLICFEHIGDAVEIWINDNLTTVCAFEPWSADITSALTIGKNTLSLRVTNNYGATFDQSKPSGIYGNAWFELYD